MDDKYGKDRFALACEIVSRWIKFEMRDKPDMRSSFTMEYVEGIASKDLNDIDFPIAAILTRLFGVEKCICAVRQ